MKIKSKLLLHITISSFLAFIVVLGMLTTIYNSSQKKNQYENLHKIQNELYTLNILTYEFFINQEERIYQQWQYKFNQVEKLLVNTKFNQNIQSHIDAFKEINSLLTEFNINHNKMLQLINEGVDSKKMVIIERLESRLVSKILNISQIVHAILRDESRAAYEDLNNIYQLSTYILTFISVLLAVSILFFSLFLKNSIARKLTILTKAVTKSAQRDLSYRINLPNTDEFGDLADTFNNMLISLSEMTEQLEDKVQKRTADLAKSNKKLKEVNEELKRSNQELDDFAYIASHDLKEPLRAISNYINFIREDYEDKLDKEGLKMLIRTTLLAERMQKFIDDLLTFSRIHRTELSVQQINTQAITEQVFNDLNEKIETNNVNFKISNSLQKIYYNELRFYQIMQNLVSNAIKYNDKTDKRIEVGCDTTKTPVVFYIKDNGIGIPKEFTEKVFKIFKRLHNRDEYGGGSGAGLTIVKKIIEQHGGKIWFESEVGVGTTFYFTIAVEQ
jgi:signal transduction histidine kinase